MDKNLTIGKASNKQFDVIACDKKTNARAAELHTAHGVIQTPVFMPVGTKATVKTLTNQNLEDLGAEIILGNTYHLYLRPGLDVIQKVQGLHAFMNWSRPILTDSGGYQVFSLTDLRKFKDNGVEFSSHIDGSKHLFTPEKVIDIQEVLASDIHMPLDDCPPYPSTHAYVKDSLKRTHHWAKISREYFSKRYSDSSSLLFGIIQGGSYQDLREESAKFLTDLSFDGYAIGGVSVGEPRDIIYETADFTTQLMPKNKPRYMMGVGRPDDLVKCISYGIDMFDCVMPTRNGRNGQAFTMSGEINVRNGSYKEDFSPIEAGCACYTCQHHTRAYIRHLFNVDEILGLTLVSLHNVSFYVNLLRKIRTHIIQGSFNDFKDNFLNCYQRKD